MLTPVKAMTGHVEAVRCYAGQSVGDVRDVEPAAQIIADLVGTADRALVHAM